MMKKILFLSILLCATLITKANTYVVVSPDGAVGIEINIGHNITWSATVDGASILEPSAISMTLDNGTVLGSNPKLLGTKRTSVDKTIDTPFYKRSHIQDAYNQIKLDFSGGFALEFRAYNDAVAYRFITSRKGTLTIRDELAEFNMPKDYQAFIPYVNDNRSGERYSYSFESYYDEQPLSAMYPDSLAITPLLIDQGKYKIVISDFAVEDYPGMFLKHAPASNLVAEFAPVPLEGIMAGYNELNFIPTKRANYIAANVQGKREFPWRAIIIARDDAQLADNDLARRLSIPSRVSDISWIKPGKVAWDWWNNLHITGVDFKVGRNTPTYKHYIDFASENGIEYIIVDEGWSDENSILITKGGIDIPELVRYGKEKGVGVILWASWKNVHKELDEAMQKYSDMGVAGLKVDFFDADDQNMVRDMTRFADAAAKHHMLLDYHGMKANGMHVTYPNILNFEGVKGLENFRWSSVENNAPRYAVTAPFIRTLVGPMDYTPGAMTNQLQKHHHADNDNPASESSRVNQLAMYVVFEAPLQMMADSPTRYRANQCCTDMIAQVPTVFDQSIVIDGKIGEYIVVARQAGDTWYIGAMTDRTPRDLSIDLSFLPAGNYTMSYVQDGINNDIDASDHLHSTINVTNQSKIKAPLAAAGGWMAIIKPTKQ